MSNELRIEIAGAPVPCARARVVRNPHTGSVHGVTEARTREYEERVRWAARAAVARERWTFQGTDRFQIEIVVYCAAERGDWDNFGKALTDPLKGLAWKDDAHVKRASVRVEVDREHPRAVVLVRKIEWFAPAPRRGAERLAAKPAQIAQSG